MRASSSVIAAKRPPIWRTSSPLCNESPPPAHDTTSVSDCRVTYAFVGVVHQEIAMQTELTLAKQGAHYLV
jgi:hypothetical protein